MYNEVKNLLDEIEKVRRLQRHYFSLPRDGGIEKNKALAESIRAERACDVLADEIGKKLPNSGQARVVAVQALKAYKPMRDAQKAYFSGFNAADLSAAKKAETALDKALPALKRLLIQIQPV